jgi:hypothetical protein
MGGFGFLFAPVSQMSCYPLPQQHHGTKITLSIRCDSLLNKDWIGDGVAFLPLSLSP